MVKFNGREIMMFHKFMSIFLAGIFATFAANAAVTINKAPTVATSKSAGNAGVTSLVPTVVELVTGVVSLNQQQNAMTAECEPTTADIAFVDGVIKEWAKTGQMTADQVGAALKRERCEVSGCYAQSVLYSSNTPGLAVKYDFFNDPGKIWDGYPRVGSTRVCKKGATCASERDKEMVTDMYEIFAIIDFGPADYNPTEATMAAKLLGKLDSCSTVKLNAKKRALWGEFLSKTASGVGQSTNTGNIMEQIGGIVNSGPTGALSSIGGIATGMMGQ